MAPDGWVGAFTGGTVPVALAETGVFFGHPLCAVVHNGLLPQISAAIDRGQLLDLLDVKIVQCGLGCSE